jgi:hypothetical protein
MHLLILSQFCHLILIALTENISKAIAATTAQVSKFYFHRAIPGIKLSHHV